MSVVLLIRFIYTNRIAYLGVGIENISMGCFLWMLRGTCLIDQYHMCSKRRAFVTETFPNPSTTYVLNRVVDMQTVLVNFATLRWPSSNGNIFRVTGPLCGEFIGPVNSPHKGQWRGALMFSLISAWINAEMARALNSLRPRGTYMRQLTNHHLFR